MNTLTDLAINSVTGQYFRPLPELVRPDEGVSRHEHYIFVRGGVRVYARDGVQTFVRGDLIYKHEGYWTNLSGQRFPFEKLEFYVPVEQKDLPWNNGEKWDSEAPWIGINHGVIESWVRSQESICNVRRESLLR